MRYLPLLLGICLLASCQEDKTPLPYIGKKMMVEGKEVYHTVPDWTYTNQNGKQVTNKDLSDYVYLADFFFTSCPSICPKVMKEMLRLQGEFGSDPRVKLVSFTLDPVRDTPAKLTKYAKGIGADTDFWWFLAGEKEATFDLANEYFVVAYEDAEVPGGFDHSGKILLVDKEGHIRSFSEGTDPSTTPGLIADVKKLLASYDKK